MLVVHITDITRIYTHFIPFALSVYNTTITLFYCRVFFPVLARDTENIRLK